MIKERSPDRFHDPEEIHENIPSGIYKGDGSGFKPAQDQPDFQKFDLRTSKRHAINSTNDAAGVSDPDSAPRLRKTELEKMSQ